MSIPTRLSSTRTARSWTRRRRWPRSRRCPRASPVISYHELEIPQLRRRRGHDRRRGRAREFPRPDAAFDLPVDRYLAEDRGRLEADRMPDHRASAGSAGGAAAGGGARRVCGPLSGGAGPHLHDRAAGRCACRRAHRTQAGSASDGAARCDVRRRPAPRAQDIHPRRGGTRHRFPVAPGGTRIWCGKRFREKERPGFLRAFLFDAHQWSVRQRP